MIKYFQGKISSEHISTKSEEIVKSIIFTDYVFEKSIYGLSHINFISVDYKADGSIELVLDITHIYSDYTAHLVKTLNEDIKLSDLDKKVKDMIETYLESIKNEEVEVEESDQD